MDRNFAITGFVYAVIGLVLGIYMAASQNHLQLVTHAHIMLLGFVVSFIYAVCHRLWLDNDAGPASRTQFWLHQGGTVALVVGLYMLYGNIGSAGIVQTILKVASAAVLASLLLMTLLYVRATRPGPGTAKA